MASNDDNNNRNRDKHLFYLNELSDYKVSSDDPDVRGWAVKDADKRIIGKVDNLLVNKKTERVVYLDVEVDKSIIDANHDPYSSSASDGVHEFVNKDGEEHIIIPIGLVKLNEDDKFVFTNKVNHKTFAETKRIKKGSNVNREYETMVLESYNRDTNSSGERYDKNTAQGKSNRDVDRDIELPRNTDTKSGNYRGTDQGHSDVSPGTSSPRHNKDSGSGKMQDDFDSSENKNTSFSRETHDSKSGNSGTEKSASSNRPRENDEEKDFYNKKEFDDSNYRKRK